MPLSLSRSSSAMSNVTTPTIRSPRTTSPVRNSSNIIPPMSSVYVKKVTLTSKKNWWLVEMDEHEEPIPNTSVNSFSSSEETAVAHHETHPIISQPYADIDPGSRSPSPPLPFHGPSVTRPPRQPSSIFDFPTPAPFAPPPSAGDTYHNHHTVRNPTAQLTPFASGSTSELFQCIVKKPEVVQLELNGELQSNASDVTTQFLAELRVYTTVAAHRNLPVFLGCLEGVGMVLEYIDGRTLLDAVRARSPALSQAQKIDYHNQLVDGLTHLHAHGLSHGDLSLLNVYVTRTSETIKIIDFGRSVASDSALDPPSALPEDPFSYLPSHMKSHHRTNSYTSSGPPTKRRKVEQIHLGTRPFTAPEVLRGECQDAILADAYSLGIILSCIDQGALVDVEPEIQIADEIPDFLLDGCELFRDRIVAYLQRWDRRRRIEKEDMIAVKRWWDEE